MYVREREREGGGEGEGEGERERERERRREGETLRGGEAACRGGSFHQIDTCMLASFLSTAVGANPKHPRLSALEPAERVAAPRRAARYLGHPSMKAWIAKAPVDNSRVDAPKRANSAKEGLNHILNPINPKP